METDTVFRMSFAVASMLVAVWAVQPAFAAGVPPAPTNLRLGTVTATSAQLSWTLNAQEVTDSEVGYGLTGLPGLIIVSAGANATSTTISNLQTGKSYDFKVRSCNLTGCSGWTNIVTAAYGWFNLAVSVSGAGKVTSAPAGINCGQGGTRCSQIFPPGTEITLHATPYINLLKGIEHDFDHWSGACAGNSAQTCTLMLTSDSATKAYFN